MSAVLAKDLTLECCLESRVQSKRLTIVPSIKLSAPLEEEFSVPRKAERYSMHILPLSISRRPLEIVDTTFIVKPEETIVEGDILPDDDDDDDEPNGTYRAHNPYYHSHLLVTQPGRLMIDSQPNIPTRLCFSPTMIQDASELPGDETRESSPSATPHREETNRGTIKTLLLQIDQNRTRKIGKERIRSSFAVRILQTSSISSKIIVVLVKHFCLIP